MLGRNVVVAGGSEPPSDWDGCERIRIDADAVREPLPTVERLRAAAFERRGVVIELIDDTAPPAVERRPVHELGARFAFDGDELHHLVWSNSVDGRDPDGLKWWLVDRAVALGAAFGGAADVVLPDGTAVWLDGGPVRFTDPVDGCPVLHGVAVEHGSLAPPVSNVSGADLAADQLAAVVHAGGAARIIAPAGSGKTRVLTERARHLLVGWRLPPSAVSLVAFNKRAQEEMRERTADLPGLQVRTLNAIALAIVNGVPPFLAQPRSWRTIDEPDVRRVLSKLIGFPKRRNTDPVAPWIEALSAIRLGLVDPLEVERRYGGDVDGLAEVWPKYRAELEREGAVDFDDQIYRAVEVLLGQPDARAAAQRACRLMLVDEFQDLTPAHLLLVRLLSAPGGAVFGVGDDDQTIYGYNGADPDWLIDFGTLFPGAGDHPLEVNYRCPAGIVESVDRLLRHNRRRVAKTMRAAAVEPGGWSVDTSDDPVGSTTAAVEAVLGAGGGAGRCRGAHACERVAGAGAVGARRGRRSRGWWGRARVRRSDVGAGGARLVAARHRRRRVQRPRTCPRRCVGRRVRCTRGSPSGSPSRATSPACGGSRRGSTPSATPSGWRGSPTTSSGCSGSRAPGRRRPRSSTSCSTTTSD